MSEEIKEGDVVQLKSDGPKMTVVKKLPNGNIFRCAWFVGDEGNKEARSADFSLPSLKKVGK